MMKQECLRCVLSNVCFVYVYVLRWYFIRFNQVLSKFPEFKLVILSYIETLVYGAYEQRTFKLK